MSSKSVKKNYLYNVTYQILTMLAPLITTPYVSRVLGAENIGTYSYSASIVSYFTLFASLGTASYGAREIAYTQDDRKKRTTIFWNTEILSCISTLICIVIYLAISMLFRDYHIIYFIFLMNIVSVAFDISWVFQGMEEFGFIVSRNIIFKILNIAFIFGFVKNRNDLVLYTVGMTLIPLISTFTLWPFLSKMIDKPSYKSIHPFSDIKTVCSMFIPTIAISVYAVLDKTMIGLYTDTRIENGYYEQATKLSKTALTLVTSLGTVMIPRIGFYYKKNDIDSVRHYMYRSYRFVWLLGIPLCLGLISISSNLVPWFYGQDFLEVSKLLNVLSFLILAIGINNVTGMQYLMPTGRQNTFTFTVVIGALVNFVLNNILIPKCYSIGAAISSVVAETIIAIIQLIIVREEINPVSIIYCSFKYWIAGIGMFFSLYYIEKYLHSSIINTVVMICVGVLFYEAILLILKDSFFLNQIKSVLVKIKRKFDNRFRRRE